MENHTDWTEQDRSQLNAAWDLMGQADKERKEQQTLVLDQVAQKVSKLIFVDILLCIADSETVSDFKITDKPLGKPQCNDFSFGDYFVNEQLHGGHTGDSFCGSISIPLGKGEYLQFDYAM